MFSQKSGVAWLVVFLGNPGKEFENSRHNAGFLTAAQVEARENLRINRLKFRALVCKTTLGGENVLLMKPQTFMNLSGEAVRQAVDFYKIPPEHVLVVSDDISLPCGKLRIRRSGSDGGQKGLRSIIQHLGTENFPRIKVGVGAPPHKDYEMADWVLGSPVGEDAKAFAEATKRAAEAVEYFLRFGIEQAMNEFN